MLDLLDDKFSIEVMRSGGINDIGCR